MYKILGVGKSQPGKVREAIAASKGLAEYMNSKHDVKVQVHLQQFMYSASPLLAAMASRTLPEIGRAHV